MADVTPAQAAEDLKKTIVDLKSAADKIASQDAMLTDLKTTIKTLQQAQQAADLAAVNRETEPTDAAIRKYARPAATRDEMAKRGGVATLKDGQIVTENRRWAGAGAGVVRLLGGMEDGGWHDGLLDDPRPQSDWQREAQDKAEKLKWRKVLSGHVPQSQWDEFTAHMKKGPGIIGKVFADNAGEGGEWIVSIPMAMMERTLELERRIESQIPTMEMASSTVTVPFLTTGAQPFLHNVPTTGDLNPGVLPKTVPVTSDRTITAKTLSVDIPVDSDASEDSIVPAIPLMQQLTGEALIDGSEDAFINGDSAAVHGDTAFATWNPRSRWQVLGASNDHRRGWIGWRQRAYDVDATVATAATDQGAIGETVVLYMGALAGLSSPHGFGKVLYITSPEHFLAKIVNDTNLLTVDKYGPAATIITGEVGKIGRYPLILSDFITPDLAASGLFTGSGAKTGMVVVNVGRYLVARRRARRIEVERVIREHTTYVVASERKTLHTWDGNAVANVRWLFNLSIS